MNAQDALDTLPPRERFARTRHPTPRVMPYVQ
jgi:hypothetical protein